MPTPVEIMAMSASLMNDTVQSVYSYEAQLPYLNIALQELQEIYELNQIPVTEKSSTDITVPANTSTIGFSNGPPQLPDDLIEIQQLWERQTGVDPYLPMVRKDYLPHFLEGQQIGQFLIWTWMKGEIHVLPANQSNDLKIDYTARLFNIPLKLNQIDQNLPFENVKSYLWFKTASLCSMFIGENQSRAQILDGEAALAMDRALGINIKSKQSINTRRKPFRASYKRRGWY